MICCEELRRYKNMQKYGLETKRLVARMAPKDMCFFMQIKISAYFFSFSKKLYTSHGMEIRTPNIM